MWDICVVTANAEVVPLLLRRHVNASNRRELKSQTAAGLRRGDVCCVERERFFAWLWCYTTKRVWQNRNVTLNRSPNTGCSSPLPSPTRLLFIIHWKSRLIVPHPKTVLYNCGKVSDHLSCLWNSFPQMHRCSSSFLSTPKRRQSHLHPARFL